MLGKIMSSNNNNLIDDTKGKISVVNDGVGMFERLINIFKTNSLWTLFKTLVFSIFFGIVIFFFLQPTYFFEKYNQYQDDKHTIELNERFEKVSKVNGKLNNLLYELHADRIFFIEYHNSVKSLQGAPFAYGSMSFEKLHSNRNVIFMGDEFTDFPLTKYETVSYLYTNKFFIGTVDDLKNIDARLTSKLKTNNVTQIALIEVWGNNQPLGILGASWSEHEVLSTYRDAIENVMRQRSAEIRVLLNN